MWPEMFDPSQTRLVKVVEKTTTITYYEAAEDRATLLNSYSYPSVRVITTPTMFHFTYIVLTGGFLNRAAALCLRRFRSDGTRTNELGRTLPTGTCTESSCSRSRSVCTA